MIYQRKIYSELLKHSKSNYTTVLTGMRRTGKTTLAKQVMAELGNENSLFLDLERLDNREIFLQKNYDHIRDTFASRGLSTKKKMLIVLDEIQNVKQAPSVIKYLSDHYQIKFLVTGSSSFYLKNVFSESLAGRKKIFELYPLDFGEYLTFREIEYVAKNDWRKSKINRAEYSRLIGYYNDYIEYGGFPQVVLASSKEEKHDFLADIMSSYISVDVKSLSNFADERNIYRLIKLLAGRVGSRLDVSKLARIVGLSRPTVNNYLDFLEKTYLIATVGVYTSSPEREIVKARKVYFSDTGLANYLAELSSGAQFENALYNQLARQGEVQYYSRKNGQEIDFIYDGKLALEAKETPIRSDGAQLSRLAGKIGVRNNRLVGRYESKRYVDYIWGGWIR